MTSTKRPSFLQDKENQKQQTLSKKGDIIGKRKNTRKLDKLQDSFSFAIPQFLGKDQKKEEHKQFWGENLALLPLVIFL